MNALRTIALAAVATLASLPAFSTVIPLGTLAVPSTTPLPTQVYATTVASFTDEFTFTISAAAGSMALTTEMNFTPIAGAGKVTLTAMELRTSGGTLLGTGTISGTTIIGSFGTITAGDYKIVVKGSSSAPTGGMPAGSYGGSLGLTAVPEPGTLALFGLGLAVAGFAGRRGRKTQVA